MNRENYIEVDRHFHQLTDKRTPENDDADIREMLAINVGRPSTWEQLLINYRTVILAEAGSGKTEEILHSALKLRANGKPAFFIRLEHITEGLEISFEEGTYEEFQKWMASTDEGWLLLDSVDEARLKDPKDFERAIRTLSVKLSSALQRVHIVITSRISAWRPKSDLILCETQLPYVFPVEKEQSAESDESTSESQPKRKINAEKKEDAEKSVFKIYSLGDLSSEQVKIFVNGKGINDSGQFLEQIERQDAWAYTTRPQDLEDLVAFWNEHRRIGTRLELMQHSVERRLKERDPDRAEAKPLQLKKAREGAHLIAAANIFMHESAIKVPDSGATPAGVDVKSILDDWSDKDCQILLDRPIFDEAIYGTVRFHHRSVREYLTAEWLSELLKQDIHRKKIEDLFFRTQYGMKVITPAMKPVLSWLSLFDTKIMQRVYSLEPEIILEGGDPARLPLETRKEILKSVCERISSRTSSGAAEDRAALQRFSSPDLASDVKDLIKKYIDNEDVIGYLLRMIWQGRIKDALPETKVLALSLNSKKYVRIAAIRALKEIGNKEDFDEFLNAYQAEDARHDRRIFAEIIDKLDATRDSTQWILHGLEKVADKKKHESEGLRYSLLKFAERLDLDIAGEMLAGIDRFLRRDPVIERRYCEISRYYGWLMQVSATIVERLITHRHPSVFLAESLFILCQLPAFHDYEFGGMSQENNFPKLISGWKELNHALFWYNAAQTRQNVTKKKEEAVNDFWQVSLFGHYWSFNAKDFELIKRDISERPLLDDRMIALSLAFELYKQNNRPAMWLEELKKAISNDAALKNRLSELLHPPAQSEETKKWKQKESEWKRRSAEKEKKRQEDDAKFLEWITKNFETLRRNGLERGTFSRNQYYLHERMRRYKENISSRWTAGNWRDLIPEYGEAVAAAFRDGVVDFWRTYQPELRSEKDEGNTTPFSIIFGLTGLEIESKETPNWPKNLNESEADLACRYAFHELNEFPDWFPKLSAHFPAKVKNLILKEIDWELNTETPEQAKHYILSRISWSHDWLWDGLAEDLFERIKKEPVNLENLERLLKVIQRSTKVSDQRIALFSSEKCKSVTSLDNISYWFSAWIGTDPKLAIPFLSSYLTTVQDTDLAKKLAMNVAVHLVGDRRSGSNARDAFKKPKYLKDLYILMHQYVRVEEDIERAGTGAYSPNLRDHAQEARNRIFSILTEIAGKEAYLALIELAEHHPVQTSRSWMMRSARKRAECDADITKWPEKKFIEFSKFLESTPSNARELFDLAVQRIYDLKHALEESDTSNAPILKDVKEETKIRNYVGGWCRDRAAGKYHIPQEEEFADAKRADLRFLGAGDYAVPVELKLADNNWSGAKLCERLENQLCGDYLRDERSKYGIFLLFYRGDKISWQMPDGKQKVNFSELINALQGYWQAISSRFVNIEEVAVIGIDLTKRDA